MTDLPLIPPGKYRYDNRPVFVKYNEKWHVWGPEYDIHEDQVCEVYRFEQDGLEPVHILEYVAYRLVKKQSNATVRFVMATFDGVVAEVEGL